VTAALLEQLVELVASRVAEKLAASKPAFYSKADPPPNVSWRTVLDACRRGELVLIRRGRIALVARADYERWLEAGRAARPARPRLVSVSDGVTLAKLGVAVGGRR